MKKTLTFTILLISFLIETRSQSLTGTWVFTGGSIELTLLLNQDGTGEFQGMPIKYKAQNGQLYIDDGVSPVVYNYKLSQNSLVLTGGGMQMAVTFLRPGTAPGASGSQPVVNSQNQVSNQSVYQNSGNSGLNQNQQSVSGIAGISGPGNNNDANTGIAGVWEGQQGKIVFYNDGTMFYNNVSYQYSLSGAQMIISGNDGSIAFGFSQSGNTLTLTQNASSAKYTRTSGLKTDKVDPQLTGKWCIVSSNYNSYSGGGSSSEECITLNQDGTYSYFFSAERSAYSYNQSAYGGSSNQNSDNGTWKTDGQTIVSYSRTTGKTTRYSLSRENNENGDPVIVIGGKKFVSAYKRPGW